MPGVLGVSAVSEKAIEARKRVQAFFQSIAVALNTHASDSVISTQAYQVLGRISTTPYRKQTSQQSENVVSFTLSQDVEEQDVRML